MSRLAVRGIAKHYGGIAALSGASFDIEGAGIHGLIGPNGAGKTTLFNCISGVVPPDSGSVVLDGRDITGWRADRIADAGLVRTFQIARGFPRLTVYENLLLYGRAQPGERMRGALLRSAASRHREATLVEKAQVIADRLNLVRALNAPASSLSGGQKKLLEIGRVLMAEPRIMLLDEPVAGVNPSLASEIAAHLRRLADEGLTILLIEHHMDTIARLCHYVVVLAEGRNLAEGTFAQVAADPVVQEAYMGRRR